MRTICRRPRTTEQVFGPATQELDMHTQNRLPLPEYGHSTDSASRSCGLQTAAKTDSTAKSMNLAKTLFVWWRQHAFVCPRLCKLNVNERLIKNKTISSTRIYYSLVKPENSQQGSRPSRMSFKPRPARRLLSRRKWSVKNWTSNPDFPRVHLGQVELAKS